MNQGKYRRDTIVKADRLSQRAAQIRELSPTTGKWTEAAKMFEGAARLYRSGSLGESARIAWREAAKCWKAVNADVLVARCEQSANIIPEYWSCQEEESK